MSAYHPECIVFPLIIVRSQPRIRSSELVAVFGHIPLITKQVQLSKENPIHQTRWDKPQLARSMREEMSRSNFKKLQDKGTTMNITMRDGYESELRIHKPAGPPADGSPLVVLAFGGGFVVGDNSQLSPYSGALAKLYGATVVNASYRLVPENPFPAAQNDVWDTLLWARDHASELGADPSKGFVLGGVSAGGNLSAALSQKWVDDEMSPSLTGVWLSVPLIFPSKPESRVPPEFKDAHFSREQNADAAFIGGNAIETIEGFQKPDWSSPICSPVNSSGPKKYIGLPRTYFQICGMDPLRDDGLIYERMLRKAGVETRMDVYAGVPHAHFAFLPSLSKSKKASMDTISNFGWLLRKPEAEIAAIAKVMAPPAGG